MKSSGFAFTSQRGDIDLSRLVNSLTAFETVTGIEEPHYRLMIIVAVLSGATEPLSNSKIKEITGWSLPRIQAFLEQLVKSQMVRQWNEGRSVLNELSPEGRGKVAALTALLKVA